MAKKISFEEYENMHGGEHKKTVEQDKLKICSLIVNGVFCIGLIVMLIMYLSLSSNSVSKEKYDSILREKNKEISSLESDSFNLNSLLGDKTYFYVLGKLNFMNDNIVFKIKGFGNYYYSYDCMMEKVNGDYEYWAYNKEAAIAQGLKAGGC